MKIFIADTLLNVFLAIAVDNLANAQELTAAEAADAAAAQSKAEAEAEALGEKHDSPEDGEKGNKMNGDALKDDEEGGSQKSEEVEEEEESAFGGPRPIVPFSSLYIFSPTNS